MSGSCREVYYPDGIESDERILVIQAHILESRNPVVKLTRAIAYERQEPEYVEDAEVFISTDNGDEVQLQYIGAGIYTSSDDVGTTGNHLYA